MTSLSVGIVGLPNVGKSTLFNALLQKQQAFAANYPFATIEPNVGVVPVPDERLTVLAEIVRTERSVPATVTFCDIAGLVKGASEGEGLGNKFLAHIRETALVLHVVRDFRNKDVVQTGSGEAVEDYLTVETELQLADLATLEKQKEPRVGSADKNENVRWALVGKLKETLGGGRPARAAALSPEEEEVMREFFLLTAKPVMFVLNIDEEGLGEKEERRGRFVEGLGARGVRCDPGEVIVICAKLEEELSGFDEGERREYLDGAGVTETGLETLIGAAYRKLRLMSFLTAGEKEVRAWTVKEGTLAPQAAGVIHSDFEKKFISAKVCSYEDFVKYGGWKGAADAGRVRQEGREYVMSEGDVVEFMVGS